MPQLQTYLGRFSVTTSMTNFGVNSNKLSLNTGTVFVAGYPGETAEQLCEQIQNVIRACPGLNATCNIAFSAITGKVTLTSNAALNITFDHSALADALGFSATLSAAATHTSTNAARYVWRPTMGLSEYPSDANTWWGRQSTSKLARSKDGTVYTTQGSILYDGTYAYRLLPQADVIAASNTAYQSLESFWSDVIHAGQRIRVLLDRGTYTSTSYVEGYWSPETAAEDAVDIGSMASQIGRSVSGWQNLWDVSFSMIKHV